MKNTPRSITEGIKKKLHVSNIAGVKICCLGDEFWIRETDRCRRTVFSLKSRGQASSIERGTEVAAAITSIASKAIIGAIAVAQASETTEAIAKATVAVIVVVAHCVRA